MSLRRHDLGTATGPWVRLHEAIGAEHLHGSVVTVAPGDTIGRYHWESAREEWLLVLDGAPTVRTAAEEREFRPGDLAAFPRGPEGAHQVLNHSDAEARVLIVSEAVEPNVIVYPDSGDVRLP